MLVKDKDGKNRPTVDTKCYTLPDDHIDVFNVFISAAWHEVNETAIFIDLPAGDTNPVAPNPTLCFSSNIFFSSNPLKSGD